MLTAIDIFLKNLILEFVDLAFAEVFSNLGLEPSSRTSLGDFLKKVDIACPKSI